MQFDIVVTCRGDIRSYFNQGLMTYPTISLA